MPVPTRPLPSASQATLERNVSGSSRAGRRAPVAASKARTREPNDGGGAGTTSAMVRPSGDQAGAVTMGSSAPSVARTVSRELSRSKERRTFSCFWGTPRQQARRFPSGEKVTFESTSNSRSRGGPPSEGTTKSAWYRLSSGLRAR